MSCEPGRGARFALALAASLSAAPCVLAQASVIGPSKCVGCHDHERQAQHWQKDEPAQLQGKAHFTTLKQLDGPKAAGFARAIGLADPYDVKGPCVRCHATVFRGDANAGVSCESCHGAASGFLDLHQKPGSYAPAVGAGMRDLRGKPASVARLCVSCHVTTDKRLSAAGHPGGEGFDAAASLQKIVHWKTVYDFAQVGAEARAAMGASGPRSAAAAPAAATASAPVAPLPPPVATRVPATSAAPTTLTGAAASAAAPWDWDQPVRSLPADYVPDPVVPTASVAAAPQAAARAPRVTPAKPSLPPSIAEETAQPPQLADAPSSTSVTPAVAPAQPAPAARRSSAAEAAELRGKAALVLERLLRSGARSGNLPPPAHPAEFRGPDSELMRLQDEVLALALEALRRPDR